MADKKKEKKEADEAIQAPADIPDPATVSKKVFYSIGEVAAMFQVKTSTIRFWENEFDILKPKKNNKGNRLFTPKDLDNLRLIYHLLKEKGMTIKGAKMKLSENPEDTIQTYEIVKRLQEVKNYLLDLRNEMEHIHEVR